MNSRVRLHGLGAKPQLNGRQGRVLRFDAQKQRYVVAVRRPAKPELGESEPWEDRKETFLFKKENLQYLIERTAAAVA